MPLSIKNSSPTILLLNLLISLSCGGSSSTTTDNSLKAEADEDLSAGNVTIFNFGSKAFDQAAPNLSLDHRAEFERGDAVFNRQWIEVDPTLDIDNDGLGPLFSSTSCVGCHHRNGKGEPPESSDEHLNDFIVKLSIAGTDANGGPLGDPIYGGQLSDQGITNMVSEGNLIITYEEITGQFEDGKSYTLVKPNYDLNLENYGEATANILISPRSTPAVYGVGLLELIPEKDLLANEDPDDLDGDGISGRANRVFNPESLQTEVGRFGWKAGRPTVRTQTAGAFFGDIGITSSIFPDEDLSDAQTEALPANSSGDNLTTGHELEEDDLKLVVQYMKSLAVPARRDHDDETVLQGKALFIEAKCSSCHTLKFVTGTSTELPELNDQVIRPYTDLLLHDMGEELSDNRPEFLASGSEWRTAPLWGIGLVKTVNGHTRFLHDGRARNLSEAIIWHSGEGEASKQSYLSMSIEERDQLINFLESL